MIDGEESETALVAARLRAAHQVIDSAPRILDDPISVGLVPGSSEAELRAAAGLMATPFMQTLRTSFVLRSRIAEDALADAISTGASATTFYSWLGVVPHLTIDAVKEGETLRESRALSTEHSIALSFVLPDHGLPGIKG